MHTRYPRAAVAQEPDTVAPATPNPSTERSGAAGEILWASRPLLVPAGHLVAVRCQAGVVEVALVANGRSGLSWVSPPRVLTEEQFNRWKRLARFGK